MSESPFYRISWKFWESLQWVGNDLPTEMVNFPKESKGRIVATKLNNLVKTSEGKLKFPFRTQAVRKGCAQPSMLFSQWIGDFRVAFRLRFKANPCAKPFIWKSVLFTCKWTKICVNKTSFHMKGFARGLALKQRRNATRKSPIILIGIPLLFQLLLTNTNLKQRFHFLELILNALIILHTSTLARLVFHVSMQNPNENATFQTLDAVSVTEFTEKYRHVFVLKVYGLLAVS